MTSDMNHKVHEVDRPHEISRQAPLSDRKDRRKRRASGRKQRRRAETKLAGAKHSGARGTDRGTDARETGDSTPENCGDHAVDYYA